MQERSVEKTDYSTFLSNVERGNVSKAEVQDDYIYYVVRKNGEDVVCKTVRMDDPDLVSRLYEAGTSMEEEDVVKIMTIHKSKGLEFPVVFVSGLSKKF